MKIQGIERIKVVIVIATLLLGTISINQSNTYAKESNINIDGQQYEFAEKDHYEFSTASGTKSVNQFGTFSITGNVKNIPDVGDFDAYEVKECNVTLSYNLGQKLIDADETEWHLVEDKSKKVDSFSLDENIMKGSIVLQTSLDGENWITDLQLTDIAGKDSVYNANFYESQNIQQINGCYYRVIVAYKTSKKLDDKKIAFVKLDNYDYKKYAEVYEFYLINSVENSLDAALPTAKPKKNNLGKLVNAGKDTGYSETNSITGKDPHFGWNLGEFFVNGFTRETKDENGNLLFLKNFGDTVTLWFNLEQDINCLNGNSKLTIAEDKNGYDQYFQIPKTNFKHGAMIICHTDKEGNKTITKYFDYLAANARTGADTKVELFEEGDYDVALDYEIKDSSGFDSYTNYRIAFSFSIRNGNTMFYIFDNVTGNELSDGAITKNGFKIDLAKSQYLTIDVKRSVIIDSEGNKKIDLRSNKPAKDGAVYADDGIYIFDIKNPSTGESATKTIYVGTDKYLRALSTTGLSIKEIEDKVANGYEINDDGMLIKPVIESEIEFETDEAETDETKENVIHEKTHEDVVETDSIKETEEIIFQDEVVVDEIATSSNGIIITIVIIVVVIIVAIYFMKKGKKKH